MGSLDRMAYCRGTLGSRQYGNAHFAVASGELRLYRGGRLYDRPQDRFEHIIFVVADEALAIFRGLRAETLFFITRQDKADIAAVLTDVGFTHCTWDRYRHGRHRERPPPFTLATWL